MQYHCPVCRKVYKIYGKACAIHYDKCLDQHKGSFRLISKRALVWCGRFGPFKGRTMSMLLYTYRTPFGTIELTDYTVESFNITQSFWSMQDEN